MPPLRKGSTKLPPLLSASFPHFLPGPFPVVLLPSLSVFISRQNSVDRRLRSILVHRSGCSKDERLKVHHQLLFPWRSTVLFVGEVVSNERLEQGAVRQNLHQV
ncbi:hypothetical protein ACOSQ2_019474 [Xanthoceras sorbifolium]